MRFSEKIISEYSKDADKRLAFICRLMIVFMLLVALLNFLGIFIIDAVPLYLTVGVSILIFFIPTLLGDILKMRSVGLRYFFLALMVFQSGLQYATLSYHTIIMLVFPMVMSCLYNEKKYVKYTAIISVPMIIISHLLAIVLRVVPDEPLITLRDTIVYGILPRGIEFGGFNPC